MDKAKYRMVFWGRKMLAYYTRMDFKHQQIAF